MDDTTRELAQRLRSADELRRFAEASVVVLICDLAEAYEVDDYDALIEVLAERRIVVGGPGTPRVSEFVGLELAGLLRCSAQVAGGRLADALNLKHRHPRLFAAMQQGRVEADRACRAASMCSDLDPQLAELVTDKWTPRQGALGWTAAFNLLRKLMAEADLELAAKKEAAARAWRGVHVWGLSDGVMNLTGRLDVLDARYLDAAVDRIADVLAETGGTTHDGSRQSKDVLRARALGVLANPAYALALLQHAAQPALTDPVDGAPDGQRHDPHCLGALCGTITTPLAKLRPRLELAVHIHTDAVGGLTGTARVDRAGHVTTALLAELLPGLEVTVQPVIDLPGFPAEDRYVPSPGLKKALLLAMDQEMFPYSTRRARGLDDDHTIVYRAGPRGQTRIGNLAPLSRRAHRAKTRCAWRARQPRPGQLIWYSPLGFTYETTIHGTRAPT